MVPLERRDEFMLLAVEQQLRGYRLVVGFFNLSKGGGKQCFIAAARAFEQRCDIEICQSRVPVCNVTTRSLLVTEIQRSAERCEGDDERCEQGAERC